MDTDSRIAEATRVRVWDILVRTSHWTLFVTYFVAYFTEDDVLTLHVWAGYVVGVVILLRVLWGIVGPRHARFTDFLCRPAVVIDYTRLLLTLRRPRRYLGHSPAGRAMVVALLLGLAAAVVTGLLIYAVEEYAGPFVSIVATRSSDSIWGGVHEVLANLTLFLVILHIAGVALARLVHRENLVSAMITGDKLAEPGER